LLLATVWPKAIYDTMTGFDPQLLHPSPPSIKHILGTDTVGRDVLSLLLAGAFPAFIIAFTAGLTTGLISTIVGAVSAYYGKTVDAFLVHTSDAFLLIPTPVLMIVLAGSIRQDLSPVKFGLFYGILSGVGGAAVVMRSHAIIVMRQSYIDAARVAGARALWIIFHHLLPNMLPLAAAYTTITVTGAIVADGFASFFGFNRGYMNWGSMVYGGFTFQIVNPTIPWNVFIPPNAALSLFAAALYFVGRGVHKVAEPRLRRR
jgi:peptide/nickel transport system permease protein